MTEGPDQPHPPADSPKDNHSSPALQLPQAERSGSYDVMDALADVALAPVAEIRHSPLLLQWAMLCAVMATGAAPLVVWQSKGEDWGVYLAIAAATAILAGNFMRWRRRWGWVRRGLGLAMALLVLVAWSALLIDRAVAGLRHDAQLLLTAASPWFWVPVGLNLATAVLLVLHYIIGTRRDRARRGRNAGR